MTPRNLPCASPAPVEDDLLWFDLPEGDELLPQRLPTLPTAEAERLLHRLESAGSEQIPGSMPLWTLAGFRLVRQGWEHLGDGWVVGKFRRCAAAPAS